NDYVVFTQGTANLIERLARLPTFPQLGFLLRRKPSSLASDQHKHHLRNELLAQMVLHRPVEPAGLIRTWGTIRTFARRALCALGYRFHRLLRWKIKRRGRRTEDPFRGLRAGQVRPSLHN